MHGSLSLACLQVTGNLAREIGHYEKQSSFFVQAKTAESVITGNVFFNGPRAGINANDGFGGGDEIAHNLVFSTCRESGDHGPFNSWDRWVSEWGLSWVEREREQ